MWRVFWLVAAALCFPLSSIAGCPAAVASLPRDGDTERVGCVEVNTFGKDGHERTAIIFREGPTLESNIRDWRWWPLKDFKDAPLENKDRFWTWSDGAATVGVVYHTRTLDDIEMLERRWWPDHKRRKLWSK